MSKTIGIIPARMGSSRFPGKPLADICGKTMIYHCYKRSEMASSLDAVYIATCDKVIEEHCKENGLNVIMTSASHERASDRAAEAMYKYEDELGEKVDFVVMIQGDEPLVTPSMIDNAVSSLRTEEDVAAVNLMGRIETRDEHDDPNEVKVVVDKRNNAIYFSREPIPSWKKSAENVLMLKQVCIIPFTRNSLLDFNSMEQTPLEIIESIDMLRFIENGKKVKMVMIEDPMCGVDTKEDLLKAENYMNNDSLWRQGY